MNHPSYQFSNSKYSYRFEFISTGKTNIHKAVIFQLMDIEGLYNLAMGDVDESGEIDVFSKSNNGDMETVLATVVQIILYFLNSNPDALVYIEGSTPVRIRLYQIAIERELQNFEERFIVRGFYNDDFETFRRNINYSALVISLKIN